jgi:hypothetical protein
MAGRRGGNRRQASGETLGRRALKAKIKGQFFDRAKMRRLLERANYEALRKAGMDVRQASKKGIGQVAPKRTKAGDRAVKSGQLVEFVGGLYRDLTMVASGKPRPAGKPPKSWAPRRWLYNDIVYFWDNSRKSVVIGALKADWLGRLHEFGGTVTLTAWRIGVAAARRAKLARDAGRPIGTRANGQPDVGSILWTQRGFRGSRNWEKTTMTKVARYPARPFMQGAKGVQKVLARIANRFRDTIRRAA